MVARRVCILIAAAALSHAQAAESRMNTDAFPPAHRRKVASLLRKKKWDWKTASDETLTEWAIELRRYNMVDMQLNDMVVGLSLVLPVDPTTGEARPNPDQGEVEHMRKKAGKIQSQLDGAAYDQKVADETFGNMEGDSELNAKQKQTLFDEHTKEVHKSQDLAGSGHEALRQALAILKLFDKATPTTAVLSTSNSTSRANVDAQPKLNATAVGNGTSLADIAAARAAASPVVQMYNSFKDASDAFRAKRAEFAQEARESKSQLLAVKSRMSKVDLHDN